MNDSSSRQIQIKDAVKRVYLSLAELLMDARIHVAYGVIIEDATLNAIETGGGASVLLFQNTESINVLQNNPL